MQSKILLGILLIQLILFFFGGVFNSKITEKFKLIGKSLDFLYKIDSIVMIGYVIYYMIFVLNQKSLLYTNAFSRIILIVSLSLLIISNLFKLYILLVVRRREKDGFRVLMDIAENINDKFQCIISSIYTVLCLLSIFGVVTFVINCKVTYVPDNGKVLVENVPFDKIIIQKVDDQNNDSEEENYEMAIKRKDQDDYQIDLEKDKITQLNNDTDKRYIEKYQVKEITENLFGTKERYYNEYTVYTNDENEMNIVSFFME